MAEDIRDIIDEIRAEGVSSIEGITEALNSRGILINGQPWNEARVAGLMWMLDSTGPTPKNRRPGA